MELNYIVKTCQRSVEQSIYILVFICSIDMRKTCMCINKSKKKKHTYAHTLNTCLAYFVCMCAHTIPLRHTVKHTHKMLASRDALLNASAECNLFRSRRERIAENSLSLPNKSYKRESAQFK